MCYSCAARDIHLLSFCLPCTRSYSIALRGIGYTEFFGSEARSKERITVQRFYCVEQWVQMENLHKCWMMKISALRRTRQPKNPLPRTCIDKLVPLLQEKLLLFAPREPPHNQRDEASSIDIELDLLYADRSEITKEKVVRSFMALIQGMLQYTPNHYQLKSCRSPSLHDTEPSTILKSIRVIEICY